MIVTSIRVLAIGFQRHKVLVFGLSSKELPYRQAMMQDKEPILLN